MTANPWQDRGAYNSMWTFGGMGQRGLKHSRVKFGNRSLTSFLPFPLAPG